MDEKNEMAESIWSKISDDLPESFWRASFWMEDGNWTTGSLDVADRRRIGTGIVAHIIKAAVSD